MHLVENENTPTTFTFAKRRQFLQHSLTGVSALVSAGLLAVAGGQTASMAHGVDSTPINDRNLFAFAEIMSDETAHVTFLQTTLQNAGATVRPKPTFKGLKQNNPIAFAKLAQAFENVGVGAYLMAAPLITTNAYLAAAASIMTIEARHAGYIDALVGKPLSPNGAFDKPIAQADVVSAVTPYIADLNGGTDPSTAFSGDTDILNFALLLEYLEAEFYTTNLPKRFKRS